MDQGPPVDPSAPRLQPGTGPPQMSHANDPAYPPLPGYEGVGYGPPSKYCGLLTKQYNLRLSQTENVRRRSIKCGPNHWICLWNA